MLELTLKFSIGFPLIGSVGAASERLTQEACAGTRPLNENIPMLLVLARSRKTPAIHVLHSRT
jgi:hypothetical protein